MDTMRPVFCGNFDHDTHQYDLERLFSKYNPISRIDMKLGTRLALICPESNPKCSIWWSLER